MGVLTNDGFRIDLDNKYTILFKPGTQFEALRYGEKWRSLVGDGLILALCHEIIRLEEELNEWR